MLIMAITSEEEKKNCCVERPIIALLNIKTLVSATASNST
jgi:hypothetical protein